MERRQFERPRGADSGEFIEAAVAVMDREPFNWGPVFGKVEKFEFSDPGLLVPVTELKRLDVDPRVLRPYLAPWVKPAVPVGELSGDVLEALSYKPADIAEFEGNLLVNQGIQRFEDLLIAVAVQAYDNTHAWLGVGNSNTAATATDTDLNAAAGSSNRQFVVMDATFPSRASQTLSFKATHTTGLSNFAWQEWMIDNGTANGTTVTANALNHKVTSLGTKTSAAAWAFTVTIVLS